MSANRKQTSVNTMYEQLSTGERIFPLTNYNQFLPRLDFRRSFLSGVPSQRRDGWTRERQSMFVT